MGTIRRLILCGIFLLGASVPAYGYPKASTTTLSSGQVPTASQWNTYLNYAENWINTNFLQGGNTFTVPNGDSILVNGTGIFDSIRVTGWFDLAADILPRTTRLHSIGTRSRLVFALSTDSLYVTNATVDSLIGNTISDSWTLTPKTNSTGRIGSDGKRFQSVNVDTVIHTVDFDSSDIKSAGIGSANLQVNTIDSTHIRPARIGSANLQVNIVDSSHVRPGGIAGTDLAGTLTGVKIWMGRQQGPGQPAFAARPSLTLTDVTGAGTDYTVICNTEDVDQAGSHNTTTGIFTAPVAGVYLFTASVYLTGIAAGHTNGWMTFQTTSLAFYFFSGDPAAFDTSGELAISGSAITYLSANDTVTLHVYISGGTGVVDVHTPTRFSGTLLW